MVRRLGVVAAGCALRIGGGRADVKLVSGALYLRVTPPAHVVNG